MKISIVIPVYNVENYINQCIESVLSQTFKNFEIIVVDDCSPDKSIELVRAYESSKIKVFCHTENKGLSASRNTGIQYCTGDYLLFLDSDDTLAPNALEKCVSVIRSHGSDVISFNSRHIDEQGNTWPVSWKEKFNHADLFNISLSNYPKLVWDVAAWNKLLRLDLYRDNKLSFDESQQWFEDHLFSMQLYSATDKVSVVHDVLHYYLKRSDTENQSITQKKSLEVSHYRLRMMESVLSYLKSSNRLWLIPPFSELVFHIYKTVLTDAYEAKTSNESFYSIVDRFKRVFEAIDSETIKTYPLNSVDLALCIKYLSKEEVSSYLENTTGYLISLECLFSKAFPEKSYFLDDYQTLKSWIPDENLKSNWSSWIYFSLSQPLFLVSFFLQNGPRTFLSFPRKCLATYVISKSNIFDLAYYSKQLNSNFSCSRAAITHYVLIGEKLGLNPNRYFSTTPYTKANPDLKHWSGNLFSHYLRHGLKRGRPLQ